MPVSIRLATRADVASILRLTNWAAEHTTANFALAPEPLDEWQATFDRTSRMHAWLVAVDDESNQVVGFAKTSPHRARAAYDWTAEVTVYLDPAYFGRRLGSSLYEKLLGIARAQGYVMLVAGITAGHRASEALHEKFGFVPIGSFHRQGWKFGVWHDVGYWELELQPTGPPAPIRPVIEVVADLR